MQAVQALTTAPNTAVVGSGQSVMMALGALSGLDASTQYSYTLDKGDGNGAGNCLALATTDSSGVLAAVTAASGPSTSWSTDRTDPFVAVITVYPRSANCVPGSAPVANAVVTARGTTSIKVRGVGQQSYVVVCWLQLPVVCKGHVL